MQTINLIDRIQETHYVRQAHQVTEVESGKFNLYKEHKTFSFSLRVPSKYGEETIHFCSHDEAKLLRERTRVFEMWLSKSH